MGGQLGRRYRPSRDASPDLPPIGIIRWQNNHFVAFAVIAITGPFSVI